MPKVSRRVLLACLLVAAWGFAPGAVFQRSSTPHPR
jgi:hypothetical protein